MLTLSVRQPYATLIVTGIKNIENRSWRPAHRGPIAIHASKRVNPADMEWARQVCDLIGVQFPSEFPTGGIIGVVDYIGTVTGSGDQIETDTDLAELDCTWYQDGSTGWILTNPRQFPLIPYTGHLGLFNVPDSLIPVIHPLPAR